MIVNAVLAAFLDGFSVAPGFFSLTLGGNLQGDETAQYSSTRSASGKHVPAIGGYQFDILSEQWQEFAEFLPLWLASDHDIQTHLDSVYYRFGEDALLRARLLRRNADKIEANPFLKPGRLWLHFDQRNELYQLSSAHGLLIHGKNAGYFIHDLAGLRQSVPNPQTLSVTFNTYEAIALRCMHMRAVSILFPNVWNRRLMESFIALLRAEQIKRVVFWPYRLGGEYLPANEHLRWLATVSKLGEEYGISLVVCDLQSQLPPETPKDGALQTLIHRYVNLAGWLERQAPHTWPFGVVPDEIARIQNPHMPIAKWIESLPRRLQCPPEWASLEFTNIPDLMSPQNIGRSFLLRAKVTKNHDVFCDPRIVSWVCEKATVGNPSCWACDLVAHRDGPTEAEIPYEFLFELKEKGIKGRKHQLANALMDASKCESLGFRTFRGDKPWRMCQVTESLEFQDRPAESMNVFVDHADPLLRDRDYDFEVQCVKSRVSGRLFLVAKRSFECLTEAEKLRPFGPELAALHRFQVGLSPSCTAIEEIIDCQIAAWLRVIGGTGADLPRLIRAMWLLYATPFCIPDVMGIKRPGAASIFILGDSSQGKTYPVEKMLEVLRMGRSSDSESRSAAGLLAGPAARNQMVIGEMPFLDKELLLVDEAHSLDKQIWQALRNPRREGIYDYHKMASGKFKTRTRLAFIANPAGHKPLATFKHPWDAVPYLDGPDVARFDLFMTVRAEREDAVHFKSREPDFSVDTLKALVAHNWSKQYDAPETWGVLAEGVSDLIQSVATDLRRRFGLPTFPLYKDLQVPGTVLSWAAAAANLAPVIVDEKVWITKAHVEYAHKLMVETATELGMDKAVSALNPQSTMIDPDNLITEIRADPKREKIAKAFLTSEKLTYEELAGRAGLKYETIRKTQAKWFFDQGLLEQRLGRGGGLVATPLLKSLLPKLAANG